MVLKYYTPDGVKLLKDTVESNLDWYKSPQGQPRDGMEKHVCKAPIDALVCASADLIKKQVNKPDSTDAENALLVYEGLRNLTPHQATIEGLWTYLSHNKLAEYVAWRWPFPSNAEKHKTHALNHFFAPNTRVRMRANGVSRLWWLGYIASRVSEENGDNDTRKGSRKFLEILLDTQDLRASLIERPSISSNLYILTAIYEVMKKHYEGDKQLLKKAVFRDWMKRLNLRGGVIILDALPRGELVKMIEEEADRALNAQGKI